MSVDLEKILRPIPADMAPYEPKYMLLASGEAAVVRAVDRDEIPDLLKHVEPLLHVDVLLSLQSTCWIGIGHQGTNNRDSCSPEQEKQRREPGGLVE